MNIQSFSRKLRTAGYALKRSEDLGGGLRRLLFESSRGAPLVSVNALGDEVDDLHAATVLAYLDEEGYFTKD